MPPKKADRPPKKTEPPPSLPSALQDPWWERYNNLDKIVVYKKRGKDGLIYDVVTGDKLDKAGEQDLLMEVSRKLQWLIMNDPPNPVGKARKILRLRQRFIDKFGEETVFLAARARGAGATAADADGAHFPGGVHLSREQLARIAEHVRRHNLTEAQHHTITRQYVARLRAAAARPAAVAEGMRRRRAANKDARDFFIPTRTDPPKLTLGMPSATGVYALIKGHENRSLRGQHGQYAIQPPPPPWRPSVQSMVRKGGGRRKTRKKAHTLNRQLEQINKKLEDEEMAANEAYYADNEEDLWRPPWMRRNTKKQRRLRHIPKNNLDEWFAAHPESERTPDRGNDNKATFPPTAEEYVEKKKEEELRKMRRMMQERGFWWDPKEHKYKIIEVATPRNKGGRRRTRKKHGRGANKKLLAKRRTRKKRIKARTCVCGQVWGKNWLQCSKCGREWRDEGAPPFARTKIEFEKNKVYKKWRRKALKNPRRKSDRVETPRDFHLRFLDAEEDSESSDSESTNSTTNEDEYYDPAAAWNSNNNSWDSNDRRSVGDPFERGSNSHLRRYVYGYKHGGGRRKMVRGKGKTLKKQRNMLKKARTWKKKKKTKRRRFVTSGDIVRREEEDMAERWGRVCNRARLHNLSSG